MQGGNQGGWGAPQGGGWGQPSAAPSSINPFLQHQSEVQTTYMPEGVVPAVGAPSSGHHHGQAQSAYPQAGQVPAVPQAGGQAGLAFTQSTVVPTVSGNIGSAQDGSGAGPSAPPPNEKPSQPLLQPDGAKPDHTKYPYWNLRRYRPYFDIDTKEVLWRVGSSLIGVFRPTFMERTHESPDLYGPFWVATTLIFVTAVTGNLTSYIAWKIDTGKSPPSPPPLPPGWVAAPPPTAGASPPSPAEVMQWTADMTKLSASAGVFYGYVFFLAMLLWLAIKWIKGDIKLVNMYCIYGYAMSIYIPVSILCIIPITWVHWLMIGIATALSGGFLLMNLRRAVAGAHKGKSFPFLLIVAALHVGLAFALEFFFFNY